MKVRRKEWEVGESVACLMEVHVLVAQLQVVAHAREVLAEVALQMEMLLAAVLAEAPQQALRVAVLARIMTFLLEAS